MTKNHFLPVGQGVPPSQMRFNVFAVSFLPPAHDLASFQLAHRSSGFTMRGWLSRSLRAGVALALGLHASDVPRASRCRSLRGRA